MANSMQHWNGCQMIAIDTETTGLDPTFHEIVQIAMLPLDSNLKPREDVVPFYMTLKPEYPERIDPRALKINNLKPADLVLDGIDKDKATVLLQEWIDKLKLPYTKYGNRMKIIPLGQNFSFDKAFIIAWLGVDLYSEIFHYHHRDTMHTAAFLNDRAGWHAERVPFPKINLTYLCNLLNIRRERAHDALEDAAATAELYRKLISEGLFA